MIGLSKPVNEIEISGWGYDRYQHEAERLYSLARHNEAAALRHAREAAVAENDVKWQGVMVDKDAEWQGVMADKEAEIARLNALLEEREQ